MSKRSCRDIVMVAKALPVTMEYDLLQDEWKLLQQEKNSLENSDCRIDSYWNVFFALKNTAGNSKYSNVAKVVKAALSLSHGSADVERGFSTSGKVLTSDRACMSERTLNAMLSVKDVLKEYHNKPQYIPITKKLLSMARGANQHYHSYLEDEKKAKEHAENQIKEEAARKAEEEEKKRVLLTEKDGIKICEEKLKAKRLEEEGKRNVANTMLCAANERLKKALETQNLGDAQVAQALLEGASKAQKEEAEKRNEANSIQKSLEKRKSSLISSFLIKKPKK